MSYIPRDCHHHAIQFTGTNREAVCRWLSLPKENVVLWTNEDSRRECYLLVSSPQLVLGKVPYGWWIVSGDTNHDYEVLTDEAFKRKYEEILDDHLPNVIEFGRPVE